MQKSPQKFRERTILEENNGEKANPRRVGERKRMITIEQGNWD